MRIVLVTSHYPPDFVSGATLQVQRMAEHLQRLGDEVLVFSGNIRGSLDDGEIQDEVVRGVDVRWIGTASRVEQDLEGNWLNPLATGRFRALIESWQPDVVHAHTLQTIGAGLLLVAADHAIPTILTMHDFWWWCPRLFLVDRSLCPCDDRTLTSDCACATTAEARHARWRRLAPILDRVDVVLVPSHAFADVIARNGIDCARLVVDENDIADEVLSAAPRPSNPDGPVRFAYVGGDHPLKGRDVLLDAARRLGGQSGWLLDVYGVSSPRRWRPTRRTVRYHPPYDPGVTSDVLSASDVLVIPSVARESFSIAAREALACGLAVITSDCLGPLDVVHHDRNGLVVPIGDPVALADAMRSLIEDRSRLERLRHTAREVPPALRGPAAHAAALRRRYLALVPQRP
jgi:glycosyltransferase involved in cell wall biosynthesis